MLTIFFILWIILNGRVTLELVLLGVLIAAAVFLFAHYAFGYTVFSERIVLRYLPLAAVYLINLMREIIKASVGVIRLILSPSGRPDPVLIEFDSHLPTEFQNVVLANSITLTPGTITVEMQDGHFLVHCLKLEYAEGIEESSFVKLLRRVRLEDVKEDKERWHVS